MNVLRLLFWFQSSVSITAAPCPAAAAAVADASPACGWFDSSHDLSAGLTVREGAEGELPLAEWLEHQLLGWQAPAPAI